MLGIIGGTGLTSSPIWKSPIARWCAPLRRASGALTFGKHRGHEVVFLARHGYGHTIPPHEVNYRANMWALQAQGVEERRVGRHGRRHQPGFGPAPRHPRPDHRLHPWPQGHLLRWRRQAGNPHRFHRALLRDNARSSACRRRRWPVRQCIDGGVYAAVQGPRLETAAEINRLERDGADMVGMTGMPEAVLARELGLVLCGHRRGRQPCGRARNSKHAISFEEIDAVLKQAMQRVRNHPGACGGAGWRLEPYCAWATRACWSGSAG